jgi:hypothetical protein
MGPIVDLPADAFNVFARGDHRGSTNYCDEVFVATHLEKHTTHMGSERGWVRSTTREQGRKTCLSSYVLIILLMAAGTCRRAGNGAVTTFGGQCLPLGLHGHHALRGTPIRLLPASEMFPSRSVRGETYFLQQFHKSRVRAQGVPHWSHFEENQPP